MKRIAANIFVLCAVFLTSCMKGVDEVEKQNENIKQIQEYLAANGLTATKDAEGMYAVISDVNPSAPKLTLGDSVSVKYEVFLLNGTRIDGTPAGKTSELLHGNTFLYGFDLALSWMRIGEKATALIPYYFAYGTEGSTNGAVPGYAPVRVEIELLGAKSENDQIAEYIAKKEYNVGLVTPDNLHISWLKTVAEGDSMGMGKEITVAYRGFLLNGKMFDEGAYKHLTGNTGYGGTIKGFDQGLRKMKLGEKAIIMFPSKLGYGHEGTQDRTIPPYAPLAFEVEITKIN